MPIISRSVPPSHMRRAASLAAIWIAVSSMLACSTDLASPTASTAANSTFARLALLSDASELSLQRTTDITLADSRGKRFTRRIAKHKELRQGSITVPHGASIPKVTAPLADTADLENLPLPTFRRPARISRRNRGPWSERMAMEGHSEIVVESEGVNDSPASEVRFLVAGRVVATNKAHWKLEGTEWRLLRSEMTSENVHDVVTVDWKAPSPAFAFKAPSGRGGLDLASYSLSPRPTPVLRDLDCTADVGDPCQNQVEDLDNAELWVIAAGLGMIAACQPTASVPTIGWSCVAAWAAMIAAIDNRDKKEGQLKRCRAEAAKRAKACACAGGMTSRTPRGVPLRDILAIGTLPPPSLDISNCDDGSGDPGGGGDPVTTCEYFVLYDTETGYIYSVTLLYCYQSAA